MIELQNVKKVIAVKPATTANSAAQASCISVDTLGYDYAVVDVILGATNAAVTKLQVKQSDTNANAATWAAATDIIADFNGAAETSGAVYTKIDGNAATLPTNNSDDSIFTVEIDLRGKKRYIAVDLVGTANADLGAAAIVTLGRAKQAPTTATAKGAAQVLRG